MVADDKSIGIHRPLLRPQLNDLLNFVYICNKYFQDCIHRAHVIRRVLNSCLSLSLNPECFFSLFAAPNSLWRMSGWRLCPGISPGIFSGSLSPTVIINLLRPAAVTSASAIFSSSSLWIIRRLLRRSLLAPVSAAVAGTTALLWALWTVRVASCCCPEWAAAAVSCTTPTCTVVFSSFGGIMQAAAVLFCMTARWAWWRDCPPGPEPVSVMSNCFWMAEGSSSSRFIAFMLPTTPDIFSSACSGNWTTASGFAVVAPRFRIFSTWCCKLGPTKPKASCAKMPFTRPPPRRSTTQPTTASPAMPCTASWSCRSKRRSSGFTVFVAAAGVSIFLREHQPNNFRPFPSCSRTVWSTLADKRLQTTEDPSWPNNRKLSMTLSCSRPNRRPSASLGTCAAILITEAHVKPRISTRDFSAMASTTAQNEDVGRHGHVFD